VSLEIPEETKSLMYSTWLPAIMTTVLEDIKGLPTKHRRAILTNMCDTCGNLAMAGAVGIQPGMSWNEYTEYLERAAPPLGPWTIIGLLRETVMFLTWSIKLPSDRMASQDAIAR
jgi:hypothetical protein